ncbi:MAG: hypothetical protein ACLVEV_01915 [Lachnospiraceae bacterium]
MFPSYCAAIFIYIFYVAFIISLVVIYCKTYLKKTEIPIIFSEMLQILTLQNKQNPIQEVSSMHSDTDRQAFHPTPEEPRTKRKKEAEKADPTSLSDSFFSKSVCSATDCTGLIPALPSSEAELDAYEEMYQFCLQNAASDPEQDT